MAGGRADRRPPFLVALSAISLFGNNGWITARLLGGVEGFFPISGTFNVYGQIAGHYIPVSPHQITFDVGLGLVVRF